MRKSANLHRRNLTEEKKSFLRGKRYLAEKKQGERKDLTSGQNDQKSETADILAKEYNVAPKTIRRDAKFARAVDKIAENGLKLEMRLAKERQIRKPNSVVANLPPQTKGKARDAVGRASEEAAKMKAFVESHAAKDGKKK